MANFPLLSTGVIAQYPTPITSGQSAEVIRFLDGSDQRFLNQGRMFRQWQIRLDLLNENEIQQLEAFFLAQLGDYSSFTFPDPLSGASVPNCRLAAPAIVSAYVGVDVSSTSLLVIEASD